MSTNTHETQELLRLFKCVIDTGTDVLTAFAKDKLLPKYNGSFKLCLDDKKHEIFHLWQSQKLLCCACPPAGCSLKRTAYMCNWIFKKLYDDTGSENTRHIVRNRGCLVQMCLHKYVTRHIAIYELDISAISFLLRNLTNLSPNETTSLDIITTTRSNICHAYSTKCYPLTFLNTVWTDLENALVDLVDPSYKRIIRQQIKYLRKVDLEKEEITELLKTFEEVNNVLQELKSSCDNNIRFLRGMESRLEITSLKNTEDIKQHTAQQTSLCSSQEIETISGAIQKTEKVLINSIKQEANEVREYQSNCFQKFENELHATRSEMNKGNADQEKRHVEHVEISRKIHNLLLSLKYDRQTNLLEPDEACADSLECCVLWQIATPEHFDLEKVEATLRNPSNKDETFKMKFVRKGSLVILTTIAANLLSDPETFDTAVISFLTKLIKDCDINTFIPCRVDVRLHFLHADEVSISCEVPPKIQSKQGTAYNRHMEDTEQFDVAFLNGDDENEIKWVQKMAAKLKSKYDINCTILAQGFLKGFPLKESLGLYVYRFQAVIITLTKTNYEQYDFYLKDDMPIIAIELDYLNEVRLNLRKCPYINCTTCEHHWFPRLIDNLNKKLPGIEMATDQDKINEDCEECKHSVTTVVHHRVKLTKGLSEKQFILCGSVIDEAWILNFLFQLTTFREPYKITGWNKYIQTPERLSTCTMFVLLSPNFQNCKPLNNYSVRMIDGISCHELLIADTDVSLIRRLQEESPYTFQNYYRDSRIDATRMNWEEIADTIFTSAKKLTVLCRLKQMSFYQMLEERPFSCSQPFYYIDTKEYTYSYPVSCFFWKRMEQMLYRG